MSKQETESPKTTDVAAAPETGAPTAGRETVQGDEKWVALLKRLMVAGVLIIAIVGIYLYQKSAKSANRSGATSALLAYRNAYNPDKPETLDPAIAQIESTLNTFGQSPLAADIKVDLGTLYARKFQLAKTQNDADAFYSKAVSQFTAVKNDHVSGKAVDRGLYNLCLLYLDAGQFDDYLNTKNQLPSFYQDILDERNFDRAKINHNAKLLKAYQSGGGIKAMEKAYTQKYVLPAPAPEPTAQPEPTETPDADGQDAEHKTEHSEEDADDDDHEGHDHD